MILLIYGLSLHCCVGLPLFVVHGLPIAVVSLVGEHRLYSARARWLRLRSSAQAQYQLLWRTDLVALQHVGSSQARD